MTLTVGSLFSGIGGLDLGLERAGMRVIWQSEIDPYASRVLAKHWKDVPNYGDIKKINWTQIERPDVICGGYPCQPFSTAGRRLGQEDPRHLFPYVLTAISELRPRYAILENVRGHLSLGGVSVIGDLASIGYDAEWTLVSAASQGAPHIRERLIILAYPIGTFPDSDSFGCVFGQLDQQPTERRLDAQCDAGASGADVSNSDSGDAPNGRECEDVQGISGVGTDDGSRSQRNIGQVSVGCTRQTASDTYADSERLERTRSKQQTAGTSRICETVPYADSEGCKGYGQSERQKKTHSGFACRSAYSSWDDIPANWQVEPDVGRVAHGIPSRVDRLRGLGNAVVPQVAEFVGRLVVAHAQ